MNLKLTRRLRLPAGRAGKLINVRFGKDEPHEINKVASHVTLCCETLKFVENFILCE